MEVYRRAVLRNGLTKYITKKPEEPYWEYPGNVVFREHAVDQPNVSGSYDVFISMTLEDFGKVAEAIVAGIEKDPRNLEGTRKKLAKWSKQLLKLAAISQGYGPVKKE